MQSMDEVMDMQDEAVCDPKHTEVIHQEKVDDIDRSHIYSLILIMITYDSGCYQLLLLDCFATIVIYKLVIFVAISFDISVGIVVNHPD